MSGLSNTTRLHTLDYLRGLAALSIMIYHYSVWINGQFTSEHVLGRIGLYGVSVFYVLSGLTLYHVYYQNMHGTVDDIKDFFLKRFFRIFPLLWLTIFLTCLLQFQFPPLYKLFLNVTGLFSILKWDGYIGTGVWSIGNELCFYLFFPFFVILSKRSKISFYILASAIFAVYLYFAYAILPEYDVLKKSGSFLYINPLNQVFLFLCGFMVGLFFTKVTVNQVVVAALAVIVVATFIFYPVTGDRINLVIEETRLIFTLLCVVLCFSFYKTTVLFPSWLDKPLTLLAEYSYALYLLHPIVWRLFEVIFEYAGVSFNPVVMMPVCMISSLIASKFVYEYYEKYFMAKGRSISKKYILKPAAKNI